MDRYILINVSNILAFLFLLADNVYSYMEPKNERNPYLQAHLTYISPAVFTFYMWIPIQILLGGFVIYQFYPQAEEHVTTINWNFVGIVALNCLWLNLWQRDMISLSWIAILIMVFQLSYIYYILEFTYQPYEHTDEPLDVILDIAFVHLPFSLYHSWSIVLLAITTFTIFMPEKKAENPSLIELILVIFVLISFELIAIMYIEANNDFAGFAGYLVIAFTFIGISYEQEEIVIHLTAILLSIISAAYFIVSLVKKCLMPKKQSVETQNETTDLTLT
ncbi:16155_t:CDS:2 [Cetraspora pellucida]|uniref:16155_t:CDS:1 n=1 Tax=Cetraspora pellucida TaxID=1433469 RepID=A0A9N9NJH9_9GLOM|nr:16155_t:CDS:2 [Cetraspora pellucida]